MEPTLVKHARDFSDVVYNVKKSTGVPVMERVKYYLANVACVLPVDIASV
jgi:hypothetical protein